LFPSCIAGEKALYVNKQCRCPHSGPWSGSLTPSSLATYRWHEAGRKRHATQLLVPTYCLRCGLPISSPLGAAHGGSLGREFDRSTPLYPSPGRSPVADPSSQNRVTAHSAIFDWKSQERRHLARITPQAERPFETPFDGAAH
jgi:hypothetical protein